MTRRALLRRAGLLGAATLIPRFTAGCGGGGEGEGSDDGDGDGDAESDTAGETGGDDLPSYEWEGALGPEGIFAHGVASGDPLTDALILWTRVSPADADEAVEVFFEVALDPEFQQRVAADTLPSPTTAARDFTVKLDLDGLDAGTTYYYRFYAQGRVSPIGRGRTAPDAASEHLRMALCSCASLGHGYFHAYTELAARADLDLVLHVGDYIYEYGSLVYGEAREYEPSHECVSLDDYRRRYAQYRREASLQEVHRQHPFVTTWDDHETANNAWSDGAENHDPDQEGDWEARRAAARQAYYEWLPLREGEAGKIYRALGYGGLVELIVLDTRLEGREEQLSPNEEGGLAGMYAAGRQLLGAEQEAWLFERLSASAAQWKLITQQVMLAHLTFTIDQDTGLKWPLRGDTWDGYDDARRRLLAYVEDEGLRDVVVLSGDIHTSFGNEVTYDPLDGYDPETGEGAVLVEFVTPGVTSPGLLLDDATQAVISAQNPHQRYVETFHRGYVTLDITPARIQADWWHFSGGQIGQETFSASAHGAGRIVQSGSARLVEAAEPAAAKVDAPALAP
ncbi:alkaline phosphatase D family protein [Pseudenhygromyxa sp. WMMC2535]|uniref:alkaline phosphatase D family protein n=1 Tax=Pseudenhygromyxa sp. WMMC2535 TaxID=2712867 RepID=UPI001556B784|nr:alkaline phosphatase D family protein [Pseudenhygromyxa sp. WMMC2535]NVB37916.1 alkaline phosphatase D family protein [Pseudenhygromyxa sp. WMMC2535]